jgi:hypothetical protein
LSDMPQLRRKQVRIEFDMFKAVELL